MSNNLQQIDEYLDKLPNWQKQNLIQFRSTIHEVETTITEDWKWDVPVFVFKDKTVFAMSAFKAHTKYNFLLNGALIEDPDNCFNNGLESKKSRAIDLKEGEKIDITKVKKLILRSLQLIN